MSRPFLTIGLPTYKDFDGVYFTIQALRVYEGANIGDIEFLVVDNYGCSFTEKFIQDWVPNGRYIKSIESLGPAHAKNMVFEHASADFVLCLDCHVLLKPGALKNLLGYYRENPGTVDLIQGPLFYDNLKHIATHMRPEWSDQMFGVWEFDSRIQKMEVIEIPLHGGGLYSCRKDVWPGFHPLFRGFGGEEGYIHEKFRRAGGRCLCMPWLGWVHRFTRPGGAPYPLYLENKIKNYIIGRLELNQSLGDLYDHFSHYIDSNVIFKYEQECREQMYRLSLVESQT
jgi:glycosyltransferase involved in cell wall biosynthesis